MTTAESTVADALVERPLTSRELQAALGRSQAWTSTALGALGQRIVRLRSGRRVRYALARDAFGGDDRIPVHTVDECGHAHPLQDVRPLVHGEFAIEGVSGAPARPWLGDSGNRLHRDLPWFLYDARPQGFVGRAIAALLHRRDARFPTDPRRWSCEHVGRYLVANGHDLPGNLRIGHAATLRVDHAVRRYTTNDYPGLAEAALANEVPGSSAAGEQPKFAVYCADRAAHVLVKFSPADDGVAAGRWRDVLLTEHLAARALLDAGIPAAQTRLIDAGGRRFLESVRFDRVGERGKVSMLSLSSVDAAFAGEGDGWTRSMRTLHGRDLVTDTDLETVTLLEAFGHRIGNLDMHLRNVSLRVDGDAFRLCPAYDMCSMALAPVRGEARPVDGTRFDVAAADFEGGVRGSGGAATFDVARELARAFWVRVHGDGRASDALARLAAERSRSVV